MIAPSCGKILDEWKKANDGFRLRTDLFLASIRSARRATHLAQVDKGDGSPRDLRQNAIPLLDTLILNQNRADRPIGHHWLWPVPEPPLE